MSQYRDNFHCFLSREKARRFQSLVVSGNMAASFRGRPVRSLRMRGKSEKHDSVIALIALCCKQSFSDTE